ncbi:MAG: DUF5320 domain-containing protein [Candidatus Aenigmatarchaeota archaeon]
MPCGDGTGPWWVQGRVWRCLGRFYWRRFYLDQPVFEPITLTKEEQKKILEQEKTDLELELKRIEEKINELK